jgi:hypothetical protein
VELRRRRGVVPSDRFVQLDEAWARVGAGRDPLDVAGSLAAQLSLQQAPADELTEFGGHGGLWRR